MKPKYTHTLCSVADMHAASGIAAQWLKLTEVTKFKILHLFIEINFIWLKYLKFF
jgi:hypothetical protein